MKPIRVLMANRPRLMRELMVATISASNMRRSPRSEPVSGMGMACDETVINASIASDEPDRIRLQAPPFHIKDSRHAGHNAVLRGSFQKCGNDFEVGLLVKTLAPQHWTTHLPRQAAARSRAHD